MPERREDLLGRFLQTRRARVLPQSLGVPATGRRRVPGLRREEVAADAGVSVDYYRRLEQGKEAHPSRQVVAAVARTLRLSDDERRHLHSLTGMAWWLDELAATPPGVPHELEDLLASWSESGALVIDPVLDVLLMNDRASQLFDAFAQTSNLVEMVLLDPAGRTFFVDWELSAAATVANLRASADFAHPPLRLRQLLARLHRDSPQFADLWARHDVSVKTHETKRLHHHQRGPLTVDFHAFGISSAPGHQMLVYQEQAPR